MARKYGSESLEHRDKDGNLPAPELTDAEIAARISEKIALQAELARTRGTKSAGTLEPTARPIEPAPKVDPAEQAALDAELVQAQADLAALEAAEKEAKKQEAAIIAKADAERKDRRQALQDNAEAIRLRVAEVEERARAQKLEELSIELAGAPQRNAARAETGIEAQRAELERIFRPVLNEIALVMKAGRAFLAEHGPALERLAAQTFSTSPAEYPIRTRQRLSADVYRPAERLLESITSVLRCENEHGGRWDESIERSIREGRLVTGSSMAETRTFAGYCTRDHVEAWKRELAKITDRLLALTEQGRREAMVAPQVRISIDDKARQEHKRSAQTGTLVGGRQGEADTTWDR